MKNYISRYSTQETSQSLITFCISHVTVRRDIAVKHYVLISQTIPYFYLSDTMAFFYIPTISSSKLVALFWFKSL